MVLYEDYFDDLDIKDNDMTVSIGKDFVHNRVPDTIEDIWSRTCNYEQIIEIMIDKRHLFSGRFQTASANL